jgi:uncharacterized protein YbjQ (UPF0145 family)
MMQCAKCEKLASVRDKFTEALFSNGGWWLCDDCRSVMEKEVSEQRRQAEQAKKGLAERASKIIVTTTHSIDGYRVFKYLGIESVEVVIGTGPWSEFSGDLADFLGRRSKGFEAKLQEAKDAAFQLLKLKAAEKGAHAVIGIDMDYTEFSSNRIGVIVNGTLVQLTQLKDGA